MYPDIFNLFKCKENTAKEDEIQFFSGAKAKIHFHDDFKRYSRNKKTSYPGKDSMIFEWIAIMESIQNYHKNSSIGEAFNFVELGAGWGRWTANTYALLKQIQHTPNCKMIAVEAEPTHFRWLQECIKLNNIPDNCVELIHAAVTKSDKKSVKFQVNRKNDPTSPSKWYGQAVVENIDNYETIDVQTISFTDVVKKFSSPIHMVHMDIQNQEYNIINNITRHEDQLRSLVIGVHGEVDILKNQFDPKKWDIKHAFRTREVNKTEFGNIKFCDGLIVANRI